METKCGDPICCRPESGLPKDPKDAAGPWGDYLCDLPENTVINALEFIRDQTKPDLVLWTGDSIPHNVGSLTADSNAEIMKNVTNTIARVLKDYRVYPALGN